MSYILLIALVVFGRCVEADPGAEFVGARQHEAAADLAAGLPPQGGGPAVEVPGSDAHGLLEGSSSPGDGCSTVDTLTAASATAEAIHGPCAGPEVAAKQAAAPNEETVPASGMCSAGPTGDRAVPTGPSHDAAGPSEAGRTEPEVVEKSVQGAGVASNDPGSRQAPPPNNTPTGSASTEPKQADQAADPSAGTEPGVTRTVEGQQQQQQEPQLPQPPQKKLPQPQQGQQQQQQQAERPAKRLPTLIPTPEDFVPEMAAAAAAAVAGDHLAGHVPHVPVQTQKQPQDAGVGAPAAGVEAHAPAAPTVGAAPGAGAVPQAPTAPPAAAAQQMPTVQQHVVPTVAEEPAAAAAAPPAAAQAAPSAPAPPQPPPELDPPEDDGTRINLAASADGASVVAANKEARKPEKTIDGDDDSFMKNPCSATKWMVIELSQLGRADEVELVNKEMYTSRVKDFTVKGRQVHPRKDGPLSELPRWFDSDNWQLLGNFTAANKKGAQTFKLPVRRRVRYLLLQFNTHYGTEEVCAMNSISVMGVSAAQELEEALARHLSPEQPSADHLGSVVDAPPIVMMTPNVAAVMASSGGGQQVGVAAHGAGTNGGPRLVTMPAASAAAAAAAAATAAAASGAAQVQAPGMQGAGQALGAGVPTQAQPAGNVGAQASAAGGAAPQATTTTTVPPSAAAGPTQAAPAAPTVQQQQQAAEPVAAQQPQQVPQQQQQPPAQPQVQHQPLSQLATHEEAGQQEAVAKPQTQQSQPNQPKPQPQQPQQAPQEQPAAGCGSGSAAGGVGTEPAQCAVAAPDEKEQTQPAAPAATASSSQPSRTQEGAASGGAPASPSGKEASVKASGAAAAKQEGTAKEATPKPEQESKSSTAGGFGGQADMKPTGVVVVGSVNPQVAVEPCAPGAAAAEVCEKVTKDQEEAILAKATGIKQQTKPVPSSSAPAPQTAIEQGGCNTMGPNYTAPSVDTQGPEPSSVPPPSQQDVKGAEKEGKAAQEQAEQAKAQAQKPATDTAPAGQDKPADQASHATAEVKREEAGVKSEKTPAQRESAPSVPQPKEAVCEAHAGKQVVEKGAEPVKASAGDSASCSASKPSGMAEEPMQKAQPLLGTACPASAGPKGDTAEGSSPTASKGPEGISPTSGTCASASSTGASPAPVSASASGANTEAAGGKPKEAGPTPDVPPMPAAATEPKQKEAEPATTAPAPAKVQAQNQDVCSAAAGQATQQQAEGLKEPSAQGASKPSDEGSCPDACGIGPTEGEEPPQKKPEPAEVGKQEGIEKREDPAVVQPGEEEIAGKPEGTQAEVIQPAQHKEVGKDEAGTACPKEALPVNGSEVQPVPPVPQAQEAVKDQAGATPTGPQGPGPAGVPPAAPAAAGSGALEGPPATATVPSAEPAPSAKGTEATSGKSSEASAPTPADAPAGPATTGSTVGPSSGLPAAVPDELASASDPSPIAGQTGSASVEPPGSSPTVAPVGVNATGAAGAAPPPAEAEAAGPAATATGEGSSPQGMDQGVGPAPSGTVPASEPAAGPMSPSGNPVVGPPWQGRMDFSPAGPAVSLMTGFEGFAGRHKQAGNLFDVVKQEFMLIRLNQTFMWRYISSMVDVLNKNAAASAEDVARLETQLVEVRAANAALAAQVEALEQRPPPPICTPKEPEAEARGDSSANGHDKASKDGAPPQPSLEAQQSAILWQALQRIDALSTSLEDLRAEVRSSRLREWAVLLYCSALLTAALAALMTRQEDKRARRLVVLLSVLNGLGGLLLNSQGAQKLLTAVANSMAPSH